MLRPIPAIALVPVAILLFPTNEQGIVFITFTAAFFPVLVSTRHAVRALPTVWEEAVRTMGGEPAAGARLRRPARRAARASSAASRSAWASSWICVISAEMISGHYGVGYRTWQDYTIVDYPGVLVGMATDRRASAGSPPPPSRCRVAASPAGCPAPPRNGAGP